MKSLYPVLRTLKRCDKLSSLVDMVSFLAGLFVLLAAPALAHAQSGYG